MGDDLEQAGTLVRGHLWGISHRATLPNNILTSSDHSQDGWVDDRDSRFGPLGVP